MAFSFFNKKQPASKASIWTSLDSQEGLDAIMEASMTAPQMIFKHSTRCGISRSVLRTFESEWDQEVAIEQIHFLDLLAYRPISNAIAQLLEVEHQSPQSIIIFKKKAVANSSHQGISADLIKEKMDSLSE